MGIPIEKSFTVKAPRGAVWDFLTDPQRVARCLPGAAITGKADDRNWGGTITVKVGPVTANYRGTMRFERLDAAAGEAEIVASGQETRGKGGADMRMKSRVVERAPGETEVTVTSDVNVVGVLAQFGRGMIQDVSDQLFQKFSAAMRRELEGEAGPGGGAGATPGAAAGGAGGATPAAGAGATAAVAPGGAATPGSGAGIGALPSLGRGEATPADAGAAGSSGAAVDVPSGGVSEISATGAAGTPAARPASERAPVQAPMRAGPPPAPAEPALDLGALGAAAAARAAGRTLRRPGFWIAVVAVAALIYLLVR
jgi:carbon monoxide dehydrogenase subunit G